MMTDYQKLYAYLVGQVDDVLTLIEAERGEPDANGLLLRVAGKLQNALWEAEDRYVLIGEEFAQKINK